MIALAFFLAGCSASVPAGPLPAPSAGPRPEFAAPGAVCAPAASGVLAAGAWRETLAFERNASLGPRHVTWRAERRIVVGPGQEAEVTLQTDGYASPSLMLYDAVGAGVRVGANGTPTDAPGTLALVAPPGTWIVAVVGAQGRAASLSVQLAGLDMPWVADCTRREGVPVGLSDALRRALFEGEPGALLAEQRAGAASRRVVAADITAGDGGLLMVEVRGGRLTSVARTSALIDPAGGAHALAGPLAAQPGSVWSVVTTGGRIVVYGARSVQPADPAAVLARLDTAAVLAAPVTLPPN